MIIVDDIEQGDPEWLKMKAGVVSSSNFKRIITSKGEPSKDATFMTELAIERITGHQYSDYVSYDMQRGTELQPQATAAYELIQGVDVRQIAFCWLDDEKKAGSSTDGLIDDLGVFEVKCPKGAKHWETLKKGVLPTEHIAQVQGELYVTGREWLDFMSFYPGLKPFIIRVYRDPKFIPRLASILREFVQGLDELTEEMRGKNG